MQVSLNQSLQMVAANKLRKLRPEEGDFILNLNQDRFIQSRLRPKPDGTFEMDQISANQIRTLIVRRSQETAYYESPKTYFAPLPSDYSFMLSTTSVLKPICNGETTTSSTDTWSILRVPFAISAAAGAGAYAICKVTDNLAVDQFNVATIATARGVSYTRLNHKDEWFTMLAWILQEFRRNGKQVYFEKFLTVYKERGLLFVFKPNVAVPASYTMTSDAVASVSTTTTLDLTKHDIASVSEISYPNRHIKSQMVDELLTTAFYKPCKESPISQIDGSSVITHTDGSFIVTQTLMSYVRKPQKMSIILGYQCELPEESHPLIVDLAAEYVKEMIKDPSWETKLRDNMMRTQIQP